MIILSSPNRNRTSYNPASVVIGTQTWAVANFAEGTLINGTVIPEVTDNTAWVALTTAAYCNYANNSGNGTTYGKLYNWWACAAIDAAYTPYGWRTPTYAEFVTLINYLGGMTVAGGKLKVTGTTYWNTPNAGATNSSGFTALGGGIRSGVSGSFVFLKEETGFMSSTASDSSNYYTMRLRYDIVNIALEGTLKKRGNYIRLIKI